MDFTVTCRNQPTTSVASRVPPELADAIIDAGRDDVHFLRTCGLVCKAWVPASRRRLFERVALYNLGYVELDRLLESELVTFPRYIRHLKIYHSSQSALSNTRLLSQLTSIEDLHLHFLLFHVIDGIAPLEHAFQYFRSLTRLRISQCYFESFNELANVLRSCVALEDLSLIETNWYNDEPESVPVTSSLPSLRHLAIQFVSDRGNVAAWLLLLHPVPALDSFSFRTHNGGECLLQVNTFLQTVGPSLRHLDIDNAVSCPWDLSRNTELQTLIVGLELPYSSSNMMKSLLGPVSSSIRDVVFNTDVIERLGAGGSEDSMDLQKLDQFLCQPQFRQLQAIKFCTYDDTYEEVKRVIEPNMTACRSRGILSIDGHVIP